MPTSKGWATLVHPGARIITAGGEAATKTPLSVKPGMPPAAAVNAMDGGLHLVPV